MEVGVEITRYTLHTQRFNFGEYGQTGFVGNCEFRLHYDLPAPLRQHLQLLAAFALFSGVGLKTAMGMGQVRQVV